MTGSRSWHGDAVPQSLQPVSERISFVYLEKCKVHRDQNAVTAQDTNGTIYIPVSTIATLLLGPGTSITHQAVSLLADACVTVLWVGEGTSRYYAQGRSQGTSTGLLQRQAELVTSTRKRLAVARGMYSLRFPGEDVTRLTMQQLRGREGARVRATYRRYSRETGVPWQGRHYDRDKWSTADHVNRALSTANSVLYGACHSVIVALGCSPGLGFIHTGHQKAFVHDIADLYKADLSIPCAFHTVSEGQHNLSGRVRRSMRERIHDYDLLPRAVHDIKSLLECTEDPFESPTETAALWDPEEGHVASGVQYSAET